MAVRDTDAAKTPPFRAGEIVARITLVVDARILLRGTIVNRIKY